MHQRINKREIGNDKEKIAAEYLTGCGYRVLETNYYCKAGEIDIIAKDGDYLCFIEVKYRNNTSGGYPEEAVDARKAGRISRSALFYMNQKKLPENTPCRFDVVAILGNDVTLYKNAFDAVL